MKANRSKVLVIIPAFNEQKNIAAVIAGIQNLTLGLDILVIDDGSTDATPRLAKNSGATVVSLPFNMGYGAALKTGFKYAARNDYEYVIHMDADGQHDPQSVPALLSEIQKGQTDIVIGSRFLTNSGYPLTLPKRIGIKIFKAITKSIIKQPVTDPTSGFQALDRDAFHFFIKNYPSDYPDADVIINSYLSGLRIKEIPVYIYPRAFGKSMHSGFKPSYYIFKMFLSIFVTLLRKPSGNRHVKG